MATNWEELAEQAMSLPRELRARLADRLIESIDEPIDTEDLGPIDQLWATEAKRRLDELRTGKVQPLDGSEVLRKVRDSLH